MYKFKRYWLFYITIFAIFCLSLYSGLADLDYYWQVDLGKQIVNNGDFYGVKNLCWGSLGTAEYYDHEWLSNVLFYFVSLIGIKSISLLKLMISVFIAVCVILYINSEEKELNTVSIVGLIIFLFILSTIFIKVKAYSISIGFLLLEIMFLKQYKRTSYKRYFIYMWILLLFWNNMHSGSMPLFFVIAGIYWLTDLRSDKKIPLYGLIYLISTLINPYGYKLVVFNLMHNNDSIMKEYLLDWRAVDAKTPIGVLCALLIFSCIIILYKVDLKKHAFEVIMMFLFIFMGLQSIRHLIYLVPFYITIILDNDFKSECSKNILRGTAIFFSVISILCVYNAFTCDNYKEEYATDYLDDKLKKLVIETNKDSCDGLFTADIDMHSDNIKSFTSGAFPYTRQRFLDSYLIMYSGSNKQIAQVIDYYGLTKFVFSKNNILVDYYLLDNVLYDYLSNNDDYKCLYDSDFYCYFVRKDI